MPAPAPRAARRRSARWPSPPTSGRRSRSPPWPPLLAVAAGVPAGPDGAGLRGRPRRSGVHRVEQRLARRRPRPGRRAGRQAGRPGRRAARDCCARRPCRRPRCAVVLSLLLGLVPGLLLLVLVASGWAYNAGLKRTAASVVPYVTGFGALPAGVVAAAPGTPIAPVVAGRRRRRARGGGPPGQRRARPGGRPGDRGARPAAPARRPGLGDRRRAAAGRRLGRAGARPGRSADGGRLGRPGARASPPSSSPRWPGPPGSGRLAFPAVMLLTVLDVVCCWPAEPPSPDRGGRLAPVDRAPSMPLPLAAAVAVAVAVAAAVAVAVGLAVAALGRRRPAARSSSARRLRLGRRSVTGSVVAVGRLVEVHARRPRGPRRRGPCVRPLADHVTEGHPSARSQSFTSRRWCASLTQSPKDLAVGRTARRPTPRRSSVLGGLDVGRPRSSSTAASSVVSRRSRRRVRGRVLGRRPRSASSDVRARAA